MLVVRLRLLLSARDYAPSRLENMTPVGWKIRKNSRDAQDRLADTNVVVEETLQGIASVKAFTNEEYEKSRYRSGIMSLIGVVLRAARIRGAFGAFIHFALFGAILL